MYQSDAIVIRVLDFSETSCVVTLLTREFGKITGLAKGARRKKSAFESALDLLSIIHLVFLPKAPRALDLLIEAKLERRFRVAARCLHRLYCGYYVAELVNVLIEHNDPMPEVYDLTEATICRLDGDADPGGAIIVFELRLLELLGHRPQFDQCIACGRLRRGDASHVAFAYVEGGVVCPKCRAGHRQVISVRTESVNALTQLARGDEAAVENWKIDRNIHGEMRELLNHYVSHLAGRHLRTQDYLKLA